MVDKSRSETIDPNQRGVNIGDVGDIVHSIIAGGNVENVHIGDNIYTRSQLEEMRDYLETAVARYAAAQMGRVFKAKAQVTITQPYKFLDWFDLEDANIFFGRDAAIQALHQVVLQARLTVLHAKSGAGKTSLLKAGLAPRLIAEGRLPSFARAFQDPTLAVKRAIAPSTSERPWPELLTKLTLHDFLRIICHFLAPDMQELVLILDQFEEFFIFWPLREQRQPFIDDLANCYADKNLPVRFIIALRKDFYSDLADFEPYIPAIFQNQFRLESMNREQVAQAITAPVAKLGKPVIYAPELLTVLLDDLSRGGMELPHLQIICTKLFEDAVTTGVQTIALSAYDRLGRAPAILGDYLNGVLARFPSQSGTIAKAILKELVSSEATKRVLAYATLVSGVEAKLPDLDDTLARLVNARLLRRDEVEDEIVYEMAHEYLIAEIKQWIDASDLAFKQAEELLAREMTNWRIYHTLIPLDRMDLLYTQRDRLRYSDDTTIECLFRSALQSGPEVEKYKGFVNIASTKRLIAALSDESERVRMAVVKALGQRGDDRAIETLLAALNDESERVRMAVVEALGHLGDGRAVEPLIAVLKDKSYPVRLAAIKALGQLGDGRAVEPLINTLKDENERVRHHALNALSQLVDGAIEPLLVVLNDEDGDVRQWAIEALGQPDDNRVESFIAALKNENSRVREVASAALGLLGNARAVEPLINTLKDKKRNVRQATVEALGHLGDGRAVEPLIAVLKDKSYPVRLAAIKALGQLGDGRAVEPLINILKDENERVRLGAARVLEQLGDARSVEPFIAALKDENYRVRRLAAAALGRLGNACAVEPLSYTLEDEHKDVRVRAAKALRAIGTPEALTALKKASRLSESTP